jgi:hypothetical protein
MDRKNKKRNSVHFSSEGCVEKKATQAADGDVVFL